MKLKIIEEFNKGVEVMGVPFDINIKHCVPKDGNQGPNLIRATYFNSAMGAFKDSDSGLNMSHFVDQLEREVKKVGLEVCEEKGLTLKGDRFNNDIKTDRGSSDLAYELIAE